MDFDPATIEHSDTWATLWEQSRRRSILAQTQTQTPERWNTFYDTVSDVWHSISGHSWSIGEEVCSILLANGIIEAGQCVLDIGCGAGAISIPFASKGMRVIAVDNSKNMLEALDAYAKELGIHGIETVYSNWERVNPQGNIDIAVAAFFPDAFNTAGIEKLEQLSHGSCCFVFPVGDDPFPFRRLLWERITRTPLPKRKQLSMYAYNYLLTSGRTPGVIHRSVPATVDVPIEDIVSFYTRYFAIFGYEGEQIAAVIRTIIEDYAAGGKVRCEGKTSIAVVWW